MPMHDWVPLRRVIFIMVAPVWQVKMRIFRSGKIKAVGAKSRQVNICWS